MDLCLSAGNLAWWEMDVKSGKVAFNENKVKMLGFSMKDFKNANYESFTDILHPDDYDRVMKAMQDHLENKENLYEVEYRIKTKKGDYKWFHDRGSIVKRDEKDKPLIVKGVVFDITNAKKAENRLKEINGHLEEIVSERTEKINQTNKKLKEEIFEKRKAEEYLKRSREYMKNIIDSASEIIISFDMNHRVTMWNKTAEKVTGYKSIEILNRSVGKLDVFSNPKNVEEHIVKVCEKTRVPRKDIILKTKDNEKKIIRISGTEIKGGINECLGALFIGRNITHEKELHGRLVEGSSYLIMDQSKISSIEMFKDLILSGYNGLFITRGSPIIIQSNFPKTKNLELVLLSTGKIKGFKTVSKIDELIDKVKEFNDKYKKSIILLDGIHYIITKFSFERFIELLYSINDTIASHRSMFFMRVDPQTIRETQLGIIKNELLVLPNQKIEDLIIDDEEYSILRYIDDQNNKNSKVSHKKITREFKISYPTASKRLEILENKKLITVKKEGKLKNIYITGKGKTFLNVRKTV